METGVSQTMESDRRKETVRKVQSTAGGAFLITIPKEWVTKIGIEEGGHVQLELEEEDLVVSPVKRRQTAQSRPLDIDRVRDRKMLDLSIGASYMQGHDVTEIVSKDKILPEQKRWIREIVDNLIGVEVAEEYSDRVVLQNLVDPRMFDLDSQMRKFSELSIAVLNDAMIGFMKGDKDLAQDAFERGYQSTKLYKLLVRLILQIMRNRKLRGELKTYDVDGLLVRMLAVKDLGRCAYYAYRVGQHVGEVDGEVGSVILASVQKLAKTTIWMQQEAFEAFVKKDLEKASAVIDRMDEVRKHYEAILAGLRGKGATLPFSLIIRDIRGVAAYAVALADDAVLAAFG
jgi:phosphate uptake regulator